MIVVTGAFGFIGVYLVDELRRQGFEVLATGHRPAAEQYFRERGIPYATLDITKSEDISQLPQRGVEGVIHLAGLLPANVAECDERDYIRINVIGTMNLLEYCKAAGARRFITTTSYADILNSWSVTPPTPSETPRNFRLTDDHAMYVISKNAATDAVLYHNAVHKLQGSIFRLPPVYGYGPHLTIYVDGKPHKSAFQVFMEKARRGETIEIWGNPADVRDVVYVKDVVQAFVKALKSDASEGVYNIGCGVGITLQEQAAAFVDVFSEDGARSAIELRPEKPGRMKPYILDISRAQRDFGYRPEYTFRDMLTDYRAEERAGTYAGFIQSRPQR